MFCVNCGKEISQMLKFCPYCGNPVAQCAEPEAPMVEEAPAPQAASAPVEESAPQMETPKKKKKPRAWVIALAAVVLLAVLGVFFGDNLFYAVLPAETRMQLAYASQVKELAADVSTVYTRVLENMDGSMTGKGKIDVEISDQLIQDVLGQELGVNSLQVGYEVIRDAKNNRIGVDLTLSCQKTKLADLQIYLDLQAGEMIVHVPDVLQQPIRVELEDMDYDAAANAYAQMELDFLPEGEFIEKLLPKLVKAAVLEIDDVEKDTDTFTAGGVKQTATVLTATITEETVCDMAIAVLKELKSDKEIKAIIKDFYAEMREYFDYYEDADEFYQEYVDALNAAIADLREEEGDEELCEILTYVNGSNDILAVELQADGGKIFLGKAEKGADRGFELSAKSYGETLLLVEASGKEKGKLFTGELVVEYQGEKYLLVDCKDLNTEKWAEGIFSGKMTLRLGEAVASQLGTVASTAKVVLTADTTEYDGKMTLEVFLGDTSLGKVSMTSSMEQKGQVTMPTDAVDAEYADFPDIQVLFDRLKEAGVDEELVDSLYWSFLYGMM